MSIKRLIIVILCFSFISCYKKYILTRNICANSLYAEFYETNPAGVDACYITDSINFRYFIGSFDPELANYRFKCFGDSIWVEKLQHRNKYMSDTIDLIVDKKMFSLKYLKTLHNLK